ncbi:PQQ-binding-like beta-propeller repeat protein [Halorussus limi]|uniref:PQQ-binding-like beta-propeller repeat protein n=1 Tax=Halorussus limi TaxID=2938695 RepID=A0A8U0HS18_9EURY|nr:PQQ-binding-like beta-propeller repeat protein [Halorussus limi]UPV73865.1 PQQ-binding-like beta-propeller repeat protein [Halorussus limi]
MIVERAVDLGSVDPAGSRQLGRRSSVCLRDDTVVVGLADGSVVAFEVDTLDERWRNESVPPREPNRGSPDGTSDGVSGSVVSLTAFADGFLAGERGPDGDIRLLDADTGKQRWSYRSADDVGDPAKRTRFFLPFVLDATTDGRRAYVAARRYYRESDGTRNFDSVVYAFESDGTVAWRYETDASPIALSVRNGTVAVGSNRCPGTDSDGFVALDADTGTVRRRWDPPGDGERRVGDLSLTEDGIAVASHADYRGYFLDDDGVRWAVDLGRPVDCGEETVYAYPNHVHATGDGVVFVTGNTYPEDGRETDARHPTEHAAVGVSPEGEIRWESSVGGFVHGVATDGDRIAVPAAQHFRERDPNAHALSKFDVTDGRTAGRPISGVVTAAAIEDGRVAAVEEPVAYHDEDAVRGSYRLHC